MNGVAVAPARAVPVANGAPLAHPHPRPGNGLALTECDFETDPQICYLKGKISANFYERGGVEPTTIIHTSQPWSVEVKLSLDGPLARLLNGYWHVRVILESVGPGDDYALPRPPESHIFEMQPCKDGGTTVVRYDFPAGIIDGGEDGKLYEVAVTAVAYDLCNQPAPFHGYCCGHCIMFVND